ncbi:alpha-hydroxy acid oxidase [Agrobacterium rhizogenes]|uniref:alpha-hydroxy acid oxidase n=1 Tax=Rhizobium rhizogenes TaxID=359 RepID=UPI0022B5F89D|nr:alpha-hydroxy acid oxidase [Rhizobium rhizogenes]MCZ7447261.1 alpha-hydroxy acid oxidase [Rhizobium rhizogenes]
MENGNVAKFESVEEDHGSPQTRGHLSENPATQEDSRRPPPLPAPQTKVPRNLRQALSLDDFEKMAFRYLPSMINGYIAGNVETGAAHLSSVNAYRNYSFIPRLLLDVSQCDQSINLFGRRYEVPFGIAPIGGAAIAAYKGDVVLAMGAARTGQPMIMSASSLIPLEEVRRAYPEAWFQAYLAGDLARISAMIERVATAGFETLVITVDTPVPGNRENNVRSGYSMPVRVTPRVALDSLFHPRWLLQTLVRTFLSRGMLHFENMEAERGPPMFSRTPGRNFDARDRLSWEHIVFIRNIWPGNLVIKGLLAINDVQRARDAGADGVILSNHGGRQLDHAVSPLRMLPLIRDAVPGFPLMIDGGIRRGTDVLKAIALGAAAVFVGRPYIFAASVAGTAGVQHASSLLRDEIRRDMALLGVCNLQELSLNHIIANNRG